MDAAAAAGRHRRRPARAAVLFAATVTFPFLLSLLTGLAALALRNFTSSISDVSVASSCRIVSSGVDLRSSKVCSVGLLDYETKHVLGHLHKPRFQCHDDYYWASIFQVEYLEKISGQLFQAIIEAPKEALPHHCRPDFGMAWTARFNYKINETYDCRYTKVTHKADIYSEKLFNCTTKEPSILQQLRRNFIMFASSLNFDDFKGKYKYGMAGFVLGTLSSMAFVVVARVFRGIVITMCAMQKHRIRLFALHFHRVCLILAYFAAVGWLTLQFGNMAGISDFFRDLDSNEII